MTRKFVPGDKVLVENELSRNIKAMKISNEDKCKFFSNKKCKGYCSIGVRLLDEEGNSDCYPMWQIIVVVK